MKLIIRRATARWKGGAGVMTTGSGVLKNAKFAWGYPLKDGFRTDPAELIAAAYASCFSSALSRELGRAASVSGEIATTATVTVKSLVADWALVDIHLHVIARLPGLTQGRFIDAAVRAKTNCLVSRLLRPNISMDARLERCGWAAIKKGG